MKYEFLQYGSDQIRGNQKAVAEFEILLHEILRPIQMRRGSPDIDIDVWVSDEFKELVAVFRVKMEPQPCPLNEANRVATVVVNKRQEVMVVYVAKYLGIPDLPSGAEWFGISSRADLSLYEPNSLERIRGMLDKSFRKVANGLKQPKRKYEPSATRRGRRTRMGRSVGRFSSL